MGSPATGARLARFCCVSCLVCLLTIAGARRGKRATLGDGPGLLPAVGLALILVWVGLGDAARWTDMFLERAR